MAVSLIFNVHKIYQIITKINVLFNNILYCCNLMQAVFRLVKILVRKWTTHNGIHDATDELRYTYSAVWRAKRIVWHFEVCSYYSTLCYYFIKWKHKINVNCQLCPLSNNYFMFCWIINLKKRNFNAIMNFLT